MKHFVKSRHFFSLTELIVVIAVLAILAALLFPALSKARERDRRLRCNNIIRSYYFAITLYANHHDEYFPTPSYSGSNSQQSDLRMLYRKLKPYFDCAGPYYHDNYESAINKIQNATNAFPAALICPSAALTFEGNRALLKKENLYEARVIRGGSYSTALIDSQSHSAAHEQAAGGRKLGRFPSPSCYFFMEDTGFNDGTDDREYPFWKIRGSLNGKLYWGHGVFYNLGFIDGHVEGVSRKRRYAGWERYYNRIFNE